MNVGQLCPLVFNLHKVQFVQGCFEATFLATTEGRRRRYGIECGSSPCNKEQVMGSSKWSAFQW